MPVVETPTEQEMALLELSMKIKKLQEKVRLAKMLEGAHADTRSIPEEDDPSYTTAISEEEDNISFGLSSRLEPVRGRSKRNGRSQSSVGSSSRSHRRRSNDDDDGHDNSSAGWSLDGSDASIPSFDPDYFDQGRGTGDKINGKYGSYRDSTPIFEESDDDDDDDDGANDYNDSF